MNDFGFTRSFQRKGAAMQSRKCRIAEANRNFPWSDLLGFARIFDRESR